MTTIEQLVTGNIGEWTKAVKPKASAGRGGGSANELYGIKQIRKLILDLAVRGLLVPQQLNDEPVSQLLVSMESQRASLNETSKPRKARRAEEPLVSQLFDVPSGWQWARMADIGSIFSGNSINARAKVDKYTDVEGRPYIATKDIGYGFEPLDYANGIAIPMDESKFKVAQTGAVLICSEGGSAGKKCGVTKRDVCFGNKLIANQLFSGMEPHFILSLYLSPTFYEQFSESMTGIIGGISLAKFTNLPVPLPPSPEQSRIVAKVDELMSLCDQLEAQQAGSIEAHKRLVTTLLDALTKATEREGFESAWARVADNFDVLFMTEWSVDELNNSVLQMTASGHLSIQNPEEEPATELLKRVSSEKESLSREQRMGKQSKLISIDDQEHELPQPRGWALSRLGAVGVSATGKTPKTSRDDYYGGSIPFIGPGQINAAGDILEPEKTLTEQGLEEIAEASPGDILMVCIGGSIGKSALGCGRFGFNQQINLIRPMLIDAQFLYLMMRAPFFQESVIENSTGSATPIINRSKWDNLLVPVAPLPEQRRIVEKVDELMVICDALKSAIKEAQQTQLLLADAITEQALT